jgi:hypothetical protein
MYRGTLAFYVQVSQKAHNLAAVQRILSPILTSKEVERHGTLSSKKSVIHREK